MSPPQIEINVEEAELSLGGQLLFANLQFKLAAGLWTCLLGPSGVGKSSLLRLVAGLVVLDGGRVRAKDGQPLAGRIAWMSQSDDLLPWLSAAENVALGARLRGERVDYQRVEALLREVGLVEQRHQRPATLSGGQRQRTALARTLLEDRPVVLMDEPFSALDAITRARLQDLSASLLRGRTVLFVTHDPLEALRLGHRIHVMAGRPAKLESVIAPEQPPPRRLDDPALLGAQAGLLARLIAAQDPLA